MSLTARQRQQLYDREVAKARAAGRGDLPICNLCDEPVRLGANWHESHVGVPKANGGSSVGIAHAACNLDHAHRFVTPQVAKADRQRWAHTGARLKSRRPLPGSRGSTLKKKMDGTVVDRRTGEPWRWS